MSKLPDYPLTPAIHALRAAGLSFTAHPYDYVEHGGTAHSASSLGLDEHCVIKTIVLEDGERHPLICLQHGDREISLKNLARQIGVKTLRPCTPEVAHRHTGYQVGGTSPFGIRKALPIYAERTMADLPRIYLNGGKRGLLVGLATLEALTALRARLVAVTA